MQRAGALHRQARHHGVCWIARLLTHRALGIATTNEIVEAARRRRQVEKVARLAAVIRLQR